MFKVITFCFFLVSFTASGQEQKKRIMLYCNNEQYLVPLIESSLSKLKQNERIQFSEVTNLNEVSSSITSDRLLREVINFFSNKTSILSDSEKE